MKFHCFFIFNCLVLSVTSCNKKYTTRRLQSPITTTVTPPITITVTTSSTSTSSSVPTSSTSTSSSVPTSSVFIENILGDHNRERRLTVGLVDLKWSDSLYNSSKSWSDNLAGRGCVLEHYLASGVGRQNLYGIYGTTSVNVSRAIEMWIEEKALLDKPGVTFGEIGHYLNIVAEGIGWVGCGVSSSSVSNCAVVTCNYV